MIRFVLPWPPATGNDLYEGTGRARHLRMCVRDYWRVLNLRWIQAGRPTFSGPVSLSWTVIQPRENDVDWDNIRKIIMDGLSAPRGRNKHVRALMFPRDSMLLIQQETMRWIGVSRTKHGIVVEIREITERPQPHGAGGVSSMGDAELAPAADNDLPRSGAGGAAGGRLGSENRLQPWPLFLLGGDAVICGRGAGRQQAIPLDESAGATDDTATQQRQGE